jgi:excisionase family DNA binding protein
MTVDELATITHTKKSWWYQRLSEGNCPIPHLKIGRHFVRFRQSDVQAYLDRQLAASQEMAAAKRRERER